MMSLSLSSFIYLNFSLEEAIKRIAALGFNGIDIWGGRPHAYRNDLNLTEIANIRQTAKEFGLGLASFIPAQFRYPTSLCSQNEVIRKDSVAYIKDSIQTAARLGCPVVSVCPGHSLFGQTVNAAMDCLRESLDELCLYATSLAVRIAIEPADRFETDLVNTIPDALQIIDQLGHDNLGVVLDCGHSYVVGESAVEAVSISQDRLFHVHVNDNNGLRDQHLVPGEGTFNFIPFLDALKKHNYQGYLCVELSWDVTLDPDIAAAKALKYFEKRINQK
ncbi:MAG: sugar phosphate isomerase/epimerase [Chloroflexi bacterium]|nr:sugar phosphate isomerase/epimerase [Chloroflexota bacterium]